MQSNVVLEEARELILSKVIPLPGELLTPVKALGRILSADLRAPENLPRYPQAAVDGYAVHREDVGLTNVFTVRERLGSGEMPGGSLVSGETAGVLTGGPVPGLTGAVVPQELAVTDGDRVIIKADIVEGLNIKLPGEDFGAGELLARRGDRVGPGLVGALSAYGINEAPVYRSPRISILSLGSEVIPARLVPGPGQVWDCNGPLLASLSTVDGGTVISLDTAGGEDYNCLKSRLKSLIQSSDLVITIGGTASGACDCALRLIRESGGGVAFWGVKIKPGSHSGVAFCDSVPVISLSGNPAACAVGYHLLAAPVIRSFQGIDPFPGAFEAQSLDAFPRKGGPRRFLRGYAHCSPGGWVVSLLPGQKSSMIRSLLGYNALVDLPAGHSPVDRGSRVTVIPVGLAVGKR